MVKCGSSQMGILNGEPMKISIFGNFESLEIWFERAEMFVSSLDLTLSQSNVGPKKIYRMMNEMNALVGE